MYRCSNRSNNSFNIPASYKKISIKKLAFAKYTTSEIRLSFFTYLYVFQIVNCVK